MTLSRWAVAVTTIAALTTAVGVGGMRHYSDRDIREAFDLLPLQGLVSGLLVFAKTAVELLGDTAESSKGESERAKVLARQAKRDAVRHSRRLAELDRFRKSPQLSEDVRERTRHICPEPEPREAGQCIDSIREALRVLRTERANLRRPYELTLYASIAPWLTALGLGITLLVRRRKSAPSK